MSKDNKRPKEPKVEKFRLSLVDDNTHKELSVMRFTRWTFFLSVLSVVMLLLAGVFALVALTPVKTFLPGYPDEHTRRATVQNVLTIDSLENVINRWEFYTENLKQVLAGGPKVGIDSVMRAYENVEAPAYTVEELRAKDSLLRQKVVETEQFSVSGKKRKLPLEGKHFFMPLQGVLAESFDANFHPYVGIAAPANSVVMAVLDGTVVSAGWSDEAEYTIVIQHDDDLLSVYKNNQKMLRKTGDRVTAGMPIALVGDASSASEGKLLLLEFWYKGAAVNPAEYLKF